MFRFLLARLASSVPVVLVVVTLIFLLVRITGDPATILAGDLATPQAIAELRAQLGLNDSLVVQYAKWIGNLLRGDLGVSIVSQKPVAELIAERLESTLLLSLMAACLTVILAVPMGVIAAYKHNTWVDRAVMLFAVLGFSIPSFVVAYLLILFFSIWAGWFPVQGYVSIQSDFWVSLRYLALPTLALSAFYMSLIARVTRTSVLEVLNEDFVRTARAKGLSELTILVRHVLRNAAVPIVTVIGLGVAFLVGGVVITESVFNLPGLGRLTIDAVLARDFPVVQGVIILFSMIYIVINLVIDIFYVLIDPRINY